MEQQPNNSSSLEKICNDPAGLQLQIYNWIVQGQNEASICDALAQYLSAEDIRGLLTRVYEQILDLTKSNQETLLGWSLAAAQEVYKKMYNIGDYAGCLKAIKEIRSIANEIKEAGTGAGKGPVIGDDKPAKDVTEGELDISQC